MTLKLDDLELANHVDYSQALPMREALDAAIAAMIHYGTEDEHLTTVSLMLTQAKKVEHVALQERIEADKAKSTA